MPDNNEFDMLYSDNDSNEDRPTPTHPNMPTVPPSGQHGGWNQNPWGGGFNQNPWNQNPWGGGWNQNPWNQNPWGGGFNQLPYGGGVPTMPPPSYIPRRPFGHNNPAFLINSVGRLVYLWLYDGRNFWATLTFVGPRTIEGYRWNGNTWRFFEVDHNDVQSFVVI
jgi:hypothetical protein